MIQNALNRLFKTETGNHYLNQLLSEIKSKGRGFYTPYESTETSTLVKKSPREEQLAFLIALVKYRRKSIAIPHWSQYWLLSAAIHTLLRRKLPYTELSLTVLLRSIGRSGTYYDEHVAGINNAVTHFLKENPLTPSLSKEINEAVNRGHKAHSAYKYRQQLLKLSRLVNKEVDQLNLDAGEAWSDLAINQIEASEKRKTWYKLIEHCGGAQSSKPSKKWLRLTESLISDIGRDHFRETVTTWFEIYPQPRTVPLPQPDWQTHTNQFGMTRLNQHVLRGLIWAMHPLMTEKLIEQISQVAQSAFKKTSYFGPRSQIIGNGCIWLFSEVGTQEAVAKLAVLQLAVKHRGTKKRIDSALNTVATKLGLTRNEVEELVVPTYGLTKVGRRLVPVGEYMAELEVQGSTAVISWYKQDGTKLKSTPQRAKKAYSHKITQLKDDVKKIKKMLPVQKARLESFYLNPISWSFPIWQERYHNHLLVGALTRRLIWRFTNDEVSTAGIWHGDHFVTSIGTPITDIDENTQVHLWHPMDEKDGIDGILAWRNWLETHQIQQPFKQAHREVYLLTEAERRTGTYSNRYAAHIIKQHQFNALCLARGWKNSLRLMVDDCYPPARIELPHWGIRAEFWIEGAGGEYGTDTNDMGTYICLATDQVRFYQIDAADNYAHAGGGGYTERSFFHRHRNPNPMSVTEIPPLVFSEVMRDVDLFVGVTSIGNDPTWEDGGAAGRYRDYWNSYSFGKLSATAETRKQILEKLVPRLKIGPRCSFDGRFLVVEGKIRTYKIHMGSGNILMKPNDQYLCIVPSQFSRKNKQTDKLYLPFEGDRTMAIILSKALLLADDDKIKDPTIMHQLKR